jgi:drug/metabolite transporter (DMT)-like permease
VRDQRAVLYLVLATAAWGLSFPTAKAVMQVQQIVFPGCPDWFHSALILCNRMLVAFVVMLCVLRSRILQMTRLELRQGIELGLFGGIGMLLQTDAQHYMPASTSAFFTQFSCIFVPICVVISRRKMPPALVLFACALVIAGCTLLSGVKLGEIHFGRGEWETIAAAALFTGQILCLERPRFTPNDPLRTSTLMFGVKGMLLSPLVFIGANRVADLPRAFITPSIIMLTIVMGFVCTAYAYAMMTTWQPKVTSTQAGIIYATEPLFASLLALFLPAIYSRYTGIHYDNEQLTWQLFAGGTLVITANLLLIYQGARERKKWKIFHRTNPHCQ